MSGKVIPIPTRPGQASHPKKAHKQEWDPDNEGGEDHGDGNWIISYADMMTLLCVFFVLMYSLSSPDPRKIEEVKRQTVQYFGGAYKLPFQNLVEKLKAVVKEKGLEKVVNVEADETGVSATFRGTVFFDSGKAELLPEGSEMLSKLGQVLKQEAPGFKVVVEGHTDDTPIESKLFPSNWELSGGRASRVIRMFESMGFERKLLTAIGYGDTRPVAPNRDEKGVVLPRNQSENRRVVLRVLKAEETK